VAPERAPKAIKQQKRTDGTEKSKGRWVAKYKPLETNELKE